MFIQVLILINTSLPQLGQCFENASRELYITFRLALVMGN
jgi:hypothetical protein